MRPGITQSFCGVTVVSSGSIYADTSNTANKATADLILIHVLCSLQWLLLAKALFVLCNSNDYDPLAKTLLWATQKSRKRSARPPPMILPLHLLSSNMRLLLRPTNRTTLILIISEDFVEIMGILDRRLNDSGKNWRHVIKVLFAG